jgi:hypothetical protein
MIEAFALISFIAQSIASVALTVACIVYMVRAAK